MIIGIVGKKLSGKDTCADYLVKNYGFIKLSFAEPLKRMCKEGFDFSEEQVNGKLKETIDPDWGITPREILQWLGTEIFRQDIQKILPNIGENFWIHLLDRKIKKILEQNPKQNIVIADVRFENEIKFIKNMNGHIIKIIRNNIEQTNYTQHKSELLADNIEKPDHILLNDGIIMENFYQRIRELMSLL